MPKNLKTPKARTGRAGVYKRDPEKWKPVFGTIARAKEGDVAALSARL
jgi:hypothetical protein